MLTYNMDVTPESVWKRTTPSEAELAQPYYCTEAGVFYAQQHFSTARTDKESYLLFYTLRGAGLIEQGESHVVLSTGQALLLNCRTPQSYCTAPGQSCCHRAKPPAIPQKCAEECFSRIRLDKNKKSRKPKLPGIFWR